jgi:NADH-ubiquinone oxidoreductase chain 4
LIISLIIFISFDFSNIDYQYVQEIKEVKGINIYMGIDGISIYFVLLTTLITPIVLLSN